MTDLNTIARDWASHDPDPVTRTEILSLVEANDIEELEKRFGSALTFGTAGIRGRVEAGSARMNRAVVIRTTHGLAEYLGPGDGHVVIGFDARPSSRQFAEDAAGVLAAAGIPVIFFPEFTPTPVVAYACKHLGARAAVVVTASHNPPADNGYKVYGPDAAQIVPPMDSDIQRHIEAAPPADQVPRIEGAFTAGDERVSLAPDDIVDCYWEELSSTRSRQRGSTLKIVYTPMHGVGLATVADVMVRAGHRDLVPVPQQAEPDGTFPTVDFPNPEEPGALDLAIGLADEEGADLVLANDPDADRLAVVIPNGNGWRPLSGNEIGVLLGDYMLRNAAQPGDAIVANSIVSSPMMEQIAAAYGADHAQTLTGFKWIMRAGLGMEEDGRGEFLFGYEEALGYSVGRTVRDKDGISAAVLFADLVADLADEGKSVFDRLVELWSKHGLWVSSQVSVVRTGPDGMAEMKQAVGRLADAPPTAVGDYEVTEVVDYRFGADERPVWLGAQDLVEIKLGSAGRVLVRPSGTEPKLKVYIDLRAELGDEPQLQVESLVAEADAIGNEVAGGLGL